MKQGKGSHIGAKIPVSSSPTGNGIPFYYAVLDENRIGIGTAIERDWTIITP